MGLHKGQTNSGSFKKGQIPWNKGLTKETDRRIRKYGIAGSKTKKELFKKGLLISPMKNKTHSKKVREKISEKTKKAVNNPEIKKKLIKSLIGNKRAKGHKVSKKNKIRQRKLRLTQKFPRKDTKIEVIMQNKLKTKKILFETHKPIICCQPDIFIQPNLCIFCDGDWWHGNPLIYNQKNLHSIQLRNKMYDLRNNKFLKKRGYNVIRLWESDINKNLNKCYEKVNKFLIKLRLN